MSATYPAHLEAEVAIRDGSIVHIRPVRPDDTDQLLAFLRALPDEDRRLRFFTLGTNLARIAHDETNVDYVRSLGLVATAGPERRIVAHGLYAPYPDGRAEVAFAIAQDFQGRGLATLLLGQLAQAAAANGIDTFEAVVLPENRRMLGVLRESGFPVTMRYEMDTIAVTFPTSLTPERIARFDQREAVASANALRRILYPGSIAVIGASAEPDSIGGAVVRNLVASGFRGPVYPIHPTAPTIQDLAAYPTLESIQQSVDLAINAGPAASALEVAEQCGRKGVRSMVVLSSGFGEAGGAGRERQAELLRICRSHGMRLIGPNCIGVINTDPHAPLNASFGALTPPPGRVGLASQSGAVGLAAVDFAIARDLGFSSMVSMGNKADISGNDLLGFWHSDDRTEIILLYLESFGNPRRFARLTRSIGRTKPIIALKSGRSSVGARATVSHTGALLAGSDVTVDALFRQSGVIRTDTLDEMLDVAELLVYQPLPKGARAAIVTNVGGPAVMCADVCESLGVHVPQLSPETQRKLRAVLPPEASVLNPVDMLAAAGPEQYRQAIEIVADDPTIDAVITIFLAPLVVQPRDVATAIAAAVDRLPREKPVMSVFMSAHSIPPLMTAGGKRIPAYHMPEPAARALAQAVRYASWRSQPVDAPPEFQDVQRVAAATLLADALHNGGGWLAASEVHNLLQLYGIGSVEPGQGVDAAVPASSVARERQRIAAPGVEMLVGVVNDRQFGPTIACGAGGALVELLKDVAIRLTPLARSDAKAMLRELRTFPLLCGYRGSPACDVSALEDVLLRISALVEDHACISELDCNPVIVGPSGATVLDARIRVEAAPPQRPLGARL